MRWRSPLITATQSTLLCLGLLIAAPCKANDELTFKVSPKQCVVESEQDSCELQVLAVLTTPRHANLCIGTANLVPLVCFYSKGDHIEETLNLTLANSIELVVFEKNQQQVMARASIKKGVLLKDYRRKRRFGWSL